MEETPGIAVRYEQLRARIKLLTDKIVDLQQECKHPNKKVTHKGSTGHYDPTADKYWDEHYCPECRKTWIVEVW